MVDRIDVTAGFDAETAPGASCWLAVHCGDVDEAARVELECRLRAQSFEVYVGVGMRELNQLSHRLLTSIERNARRIRIHNEAVVRIRLLRSKHKLFVDWNAWKWLDGAGRNIDVVSHHMQVRMHACLRSLNGRAA